MPANILTEMNSLGVGLEDQRALQIALELTKLGLNENDSGSQPPQQTSTSSASTNRSAFENEAAMMRKSANMTECVPVPSSEHVAEIVGRQGCKIKALRAKTNTYIKTPVRGEEPVFVVTGRKEDVGSAKQEILSAAEHFSQIRASRRNQNSSAVPGVVPPGAANHALPGQVTIQVRVPYRVVGLVVGPKGATIKRIQQQTHTYIVTPNRDKEPIFEVTGLPENVEKARQDIESHIAMRTGGMLEGTLNNHLNNVQNSMSNLNMLHGGGAKTSGGPDECPTDFVSNGIDAGFHELSSNVLFNSMYNNKSANVTSAFTPYNKSMSNNQSNNVLSQHIAPHNGTTHNSDGQMFTFPSLLDSSVSKYVDVNPPGSDLSGNNHSVGLYDSDEGIGGSPTFDSAALQLTSASIWSDLSSESHGSEFGNLFSSMSSVSSNSAMLPPQNAVSSAGSGCLPLAQGLSHTSVAEDTGSGHARGDFSLPANMSDHSTTALVLLQNRSNMSFNTPLSEDSATTSVSSSPSMSASTSSIHSNSASSSPTEPSRPLAPPRPRHCVVCTERQIGAALIPCGHNMFCMDCAKILVQDPDKNCPMCQQSPSQAVRIFS